MRVWGTAGGAAKKALEQMAAAQSPASESESDESAGEGETTTTVGGGEPTTEPLTDAPEAAAEAVAATEGAEPPAGSGSDGGDSDSDDEDDEAAEGTGTMIVVTLWVDGSLMRVACCGNTEGGPQAADDDEDEEEIRRLNAEENIVELQKGEIGLLDSLTGVPLPDDVLLVRTTCVVAGWGSDMLHLRWAAGSMRFRYADRTRPCRATSSKSSSPRAIRRRAKVLAPIPSSASH